MRLPAVLATCLLTLAGCGDSANVGGHGGGASTPWRGADLKVTVWPAGPGTPARTKRVRCQRLGRAAARPVCRRLDRSDLAPVPAGVACTEIWGGPAVARVRGKLRGEHVDASFSRENGCEIERWDRNRALLGGAPMDSMA